MPYEVELPDGTIVQGIPDDMPQSEVRKRILKNYPQFATEDDEAPLPAPAPVTPTAEKPEGLYREGSLPAMGPAESESEPGVISNTLDKLTGLLEEPIVASMIPPALRFLAPTTEEDISSRALAERGVLSRVRAASDFFGAGNEFSNAIEKRKEEVSKLISAASQGRLDEASKIMEEAEGKGTKAELVAALEAFAAAPAEIIGEALATTLPDLIAIAAVAPLGAGVAVGTAVTLGATSGLGIVKGAIYDEVEAALIKQGSSPEEAEKRAKVAQEYFGKNYKEIFAGGGLGILATLTGLEKGVMTPIIQNAVSKGIARKIGEGAVKEGVPEFLQGAEEQLARNLALGREGIETDPLKGVVGAGTLEGLASAPLGVAGEIAFSQEATEEQATYDAKKRDFNKEVNEVTDVEFNEILGGSPDDVDTTIPELEFDVPDREGLERGVPLLGGPEPEPGLLEGPAPEPEEPDRARLGDDKPTPVKPRDTKGRVDDTVKKVRKKDDLSIVYDDDDFADDVFSFLADQRTKEETANIQDIKRTGESTPLGKELQQSLLRFERRRLPSGNKSMSDISGFINRLFKSSLLPEGVTYRSRLEDSYVKDTKDKHKNYLIDKYGNARGNVNAFRTNNLKEAFSSLEPLENLQEADAIALNSINKATSAIQEGVNAYKNKSIKDPIQNQKTNMLLSALLNRVRLLQDQRNNIEDFAKKEAKRLRSLRPAAYDRDTGKAREKPENRYNAANTARKHLASLVNDFEENASDRIPELTNKLSNILAEEAPNPIQDFVSEITKEALSNIKEGDTVTFYRTLDKSNSEEGIVLEVLPRSFLINPIGEPPSIRFEIPKKQVQLKESRSDKPTYSQEVSDGREVGEFTVKRPDAKLLANLGPSMYGGAMITSIAKETMQNSADAIEAALKLGIIKEGKVAVTLNEEARTFSITDNGVGMSKEVLQDSFLVVGASDKQGLSASEQKGGKGMAKLVILGSSESFSVTSVSTAEKNSEGDYVRRKNPEKVSIKDQIPEEVISGNTPVVFERITKGVPASETGTKLDLNIAKYYKEDRTIRLEKKLVVDILSRPLFGEIEITLNGDALPVGKNFPYDLFQEPLNVTFDWGEADVYFSKEKETFPTHSVLISGIYQFDVTNLQFDYKDIPYNIIINLKAKYAPTDPKGTYPINNQRQGYSQEVTSDIEALNSYIIQMYVGEVALEQSNNFKDIVSLPLQELDDEFNLEEAGKTKLETRYKQAAEAFKKSRQKVMSDEERAKIRKSMPKRVVVKGDQKKRVIDVQTNKVVFQPNETQIEKSFKAKVAAPKFSDFDLIFEGKTEDKPIFHNNTNMVFDPDKDAEAMLFFSKIGSVFLNIKNTVYDLYKEGKFIGFNFNSLTPGTMHYVGVSLDKKYAGVNIVKPYKSVFMNPLYEWTTNESDMNVIANQFYRVMLHELAHVSRRDHDAKFINTQDKIEFEIVRAGKELYYKSAITTIIADHAETLSKLRREFNGFKTTNRFQSLEDFEQGVSSRRPEDREVGYYSKVRPSFSRREPGRDGDDDPVSFGPESRDPGTVPGDRGGRRGRASRPIEIVGTPSGLEALGSKLGVRPAFEDIKYFFSKVLFGKNPFPQEKFIRAFLKTLSIRQVEELNDMAKVFVGDSKQPEPLNFIKKLIRLAGDDIPNFRTAVIRRAAKPTDLLAKISTGREGVAMIEKLGAVAIESTSKSQDPRIEADREANPELAEAYDELSDDAKKAYTGMLEFYRSQINGLKEDLIASAARFIDRSTPEGEESYAEARREIEEQFREIDRYQPYFPLKRHGEYWLQLGDNEDPDKSFFVFESELRRDRVKEEFKQYLREQHTFGDRYKPVTSGNQFLKDVLMQQVVPHSSEFITKLERVVDRVAANPKVGDVNKFKEVMKDSIRQIAYMLAASGSFKKMFMNRKAIQGASTDIQRVFGESVINIAYQRTRIRYFTEWNDLLVKASEIINNRIEQDTPQQKFLRSVLLEMQERTDQVLSLTPTTGWHKLSNSITNAVFYWFLSAPGSALINIFGMTNVSLPAIAARYGIKKATPKFMSYVFKYAYRPDFMFTTDSDVRGIPLSPKVSGVGVKFVSPHKKYAESLPPLQQQVLKDLENHIDASFAYDAANLSERPVDLYASPFEKTTRFLAALFHNSEKFNRTVVALTMFDLAYEKYAGGKDEVRELAKSGGVNLTAYNLAVEEAKYMLYKTLGDFTPSGKAPILRHPLGKVILQFKGVALFLTFNNLRDAQVGLLKVSGDPSVKELRQKLLERSDLSEEEVEQEVNEYKTGQDRAMKEMRKRLFLTSTTSVLMAGVKGFAFYSLFKALYELIKYLFEDDEDEAPIPLFAEDFDTVVYEGLKDGLGSLGVGEEQRTRIASALMRGAIEEYTGMGVQERISLNIPDLWVRDSIYTKNAEETLREQMLSNLGPAFSLATNFAKAADMFNQGKYLRAFEDAAPAILKGPLMAGRYALEDGVKTRTLNTMLRKGELSTGDYILRSIGVAPAKVARETEKRRKMFKALAPVRNERSNILAAYTTAEILKDSKMRFKAEQKRELFNAKYPDFAIEDNAVSESVERGIEYREQAADFGGVKASEETFTSTIKGVGE